MKKKSKEKGDITVAVLISLCFVVFLTYMVYNIYIFQSFYIRRLVNNEIQERIVKNIKYDLKNDEWYINLDGERYIFNYSDEIDFSEIETDNIDFEKYIAEMLKNKIIDNVKKNESIKLGVLSILGSESRFEKTGTAVNKKNVTSIETENHIGVQIRMVKIDYTVDGNNEKEVLHNDNKIGNQIVDSSIKLKMKITIKTPYPPMFGIKPDDKFYRGNGDEINRMNIEVEYFTTI